MIYIYIYIYDVVKYFLLLKKIEYHTLYYSSDSYSIGMLMKSNIGKNRCAMRNIVQKVTWNFLYSNLTISECFAYFYYFHWKGYEHNFYDIICDIWKIVIRYVTIYCREGLDITTIDTRKVT